MCTLTCTSHKVYWPPPECKWSPTKRRILFLFALNNHIWFNALVYGKSGHVLTICNQFAAVCVPFFHCCFLRFSNALVCVWSFCVRVLFFQIQNIALLYSRVRAGIISTSKTYVLHSLETPSTVGVRNVRRIWVCTNSLKRNTRNCHFIPTSIF